jgi:hypothetical protein
MSYPDSRTYLKLLRCQGDALPVSRESGFGRNVTVSKAGQIEGVARAVSVAAKIIPAF